MSHLAYKPPPLHFVLREKRGGGGRICGTLWYITQLWWLLTMQGGGPFQRDFRKSMFHDGRLYAQWIERLEEFGINVRTVCLSVHLSMFVSLSVCCSVYQPVYLSAVLSPSAIFHLADGIPNFTHLTTHAHSHSTHSSHSTHTPTLLTLTLHTYSTHIHTHNSTHSTHIPPTLHTLHTFTLHIHSLHTLCTHSHHHIPHSTHY